MSQVILAPSDDFKKSERINVKNFSVDEQTMKEQVEMGIHETTFRPMSGLLNHSDFVSGQGKALEIYEDFMDTVGVPVDVDTAIDDASALQKGEALKSKEATKGLKALRAEAKKLGIKAYWNMKEPVLKKKIAEAKKKKTAK